MLFKEPGVRKAETGAGQAQGADWQGRGRDTIQDGESSASTPRWDCLVALCQGDHVWPLLSLGLYRHAWRMY